MSDLTETTPTRHEAPDVAELRRRLDALPGFSSKHLHGGPGGESYIGLGDEGGMPLSVSGFDAVLLFAEIAALEVPRLLDRLAHMTEARDDARAEVERLTAMVRNIRAYCGAFVEESEDSDPEPWNPAAYVLSILDGVDEAKEAGHGQKPPQDAQERL